MAISFPHKRIRFDVLTALEDRFNLRRPVYKRIASTAYLAEDKVLRKEVILWVLHKKVPESSDFHSELKNQLKKALNSQIKTLALSCVGYDSQGTFFYSQEQTKPRLAVATLKSVSKKNVLLSEAAALLARLNNSGIILADMAEDSFLLGDFDILELNGLFPYDPRWFEHKEKNKKETRNTSWAAPELLGGGEVSELSDIFCWGCFAYKLIGGNTLPRIFDEYQHYEYIRTQIPVVCEGKSKRKTKWLAPILEKALQWHSEKRLKNSSELKNAILSNCPGLRVAKSRSYLRRFENFSTWISTDPLARITIFSVLGCVTAFYLVFGDTSLENGFLTEKIIAMRGQVDDGEKLFILAKAAEEQGLRKKPTISLSSTRSSVSTNPEIQVNKIEISKLLTKSKIEEGTLPRKVKDTQKQIIGSKQQKLIDLDPERTKLKQKDKKNNLVKKQVLLESTTKSIQNKIEGKRKLRKLGSITSLRKAREARAASRALLAPPCSLDSKRVEILSLLSSDGIASSIPQLNCTNTRKK